MRVGPGGVIFIRSTSPSDWHVGYCIETATSTPPGPTTRCRPSTYSATSGFGETPGKSGSSTRTGNRSLRTGAWSEASSAGVWAGAVDTVRWLASWSIGRNAPRPWENLVAAGVVEHKGPIGLRSGLGLLALADTHSFRTLNQTCASALAEGTSRLRDVRLLLEGSRPARPPQSYRNKEHRGGVPQHHPGRPFPTTQALTVKIPTDNYLR